MSVRSPELAPSRLVLRGRSAQRGFTLLEVLIAAVLLIVALVGSIALVLGLSRGNQTTRARDTAYFLAQQTLDQLSAVPLVQLAPPPPANSNLTVLNNGNPVCYPMGEDSFADHPLAAASCTGIPGSPAVTAPAAYYVRSQVCCYGKVFAANPAGGPILSPANCAALPVDATGLKLSVNGYGNNGGACTVQVEVTWPFEPTTPPTLVSDLFAANAPVQLNFQNHVLETMVRSQ